ncbi:MAG: DUF192 domain-containing protein [Candidatus Aenigmatarchaeota archaeon]
MGFFDKENKLSNNILFFKGKRNYSFQADIVKDISSRPFASQSVKEGKVVIYMFPGEGIVQFPVTKMKKPVDIIFVSRNLEINDVDKIRETDIKGRGMIVRAKHPTQYVLETSSGFVKKYGLGPGDTIKILK